MLTEAARVRPPESQTEDFKFSQACPAYGLAAGTTSELDHMVPLELGGANAARQPVARDRAAAEPEGCRRGRAEDGRVRRRGAPGPRTAGDCAGLGNRADPPRSRLRPRAGSSAAADPCGRQALGVARKANSGPDVGLRHHRIDSSRSAPPVRQPTVVTGLARASQRPGDLARIVDHDQVRHYRPPSRPGSLLGRGGR